jgi:hypothetical protein
MSSVFISYRREITAGEARALFNELLEKHGTHSVFMDVDSIALGRDFRSALRKTIESCDLMLVLIGKDWAEIKDERGRKRLESPGDYVRLEIEAALKRDIVVTPILVQGAHMPAPEQLPADIRDLAYRNGFELSHTRWESDVQEMVRRLELDVRDRGREVETGHPPLRRAFPPGSDQSGTTHGTGRVSRTRWQSRTWWIAAATLLVAGLLITAGLSYYGFGVVQTSKAKQDALKLSTQPFKPTYQRWMALATIDEISGTWVDGGSSKEEATANVLSSCKHNFGKDCVLVSATNSECLGIARRGSEVYWSFDISPRRAALSSIDKCEVASRNSCGLHFVTCPDGTGYFLSQEWPDQ